MNKIFSLALTSVVGLVGNTALAQTYDGYPTDVSTAGMGLGIGLIILWIVLMVVNLVLFIFWIWMLVDVIKRKFEQKVLWIVLVIILGYIGAIAYYFVVKRKHTGETPGSVPSVQSPTPPAQPPQQPTV